MKNYQPRRRNEHGKLVPLVGKPGHPDLSSIIRRIEREYFFRELEEPSHRGIAALRRMPENLWRELIDALPVCRCGRIVSPARALHPAESCSPRCSKRGIHLSQDRRRFHRKQEQLAIAEAITQL